VDKLGTTFAALSDPTRRAMIERLSHGPASVRGLTEPFALSQQMISKHIAYLVRARIVIKTKRGRESVCTLRPEAIKTVSDWATSYRRFWEESFDKLDVVVVAPRVDVRCLMLDDFLEKAICAPLLRSTMMCLLSPRN
jgi:DNA-binding transcriptional ArsR family regulator